MRPNFLPRDKGPLDDLMALQRQLEATTMELVAERTRRVNAEKLLAHIEARIDEALAGVRAGRPVPPRWWGGDPPNAAAHNATRAMMDNRVPDMPIHTAVPPLIYGDFTQPPKCSHLGPLKRETDSHTMDEIHRCVGCGAVVLRNGKAPMEPGQ